MLFLQEGGFVGLAVFLNFFYRKEEAMVKLGIYERRGTDEISRSAFYAVMGSVITWGLIATGIVSHLCANWHPSTLEYWLVGLGLPILGIVMSMSTSALVSFIGFNLVAIPFGAILGPLLAQYKLAMPGVVTQAALLTACVTVVMALSGMAFPNFYRSIGGALFWALVALVVVGVLSLFIPALANLMIVHYLAVGLFALYIGFDMWRASEIPATLDNAVDVSISLYLDIINLFIRILAILGNSRSDD
jgi:FtsH-binding integral membrane protein